MRRESKADEGAGGVRSAPARNLPPPRLSTDSDSIVGRQSDSVTSRKGEVARAVPCGFSFAPTGDQEMHSIPTRRPNACLIDFSFMRQHRG